MTAKDNLSLYRQKRDFSKTPEPKGIAAAKAGFHYLIQKHAASRLHYDFRLELDGTLKSWAVTRGPSLDPHEKRLAVEVEDHPVAYGSFEGIIPQGQYGGGTVMLWDEGSWEPIGDPHQGLKKGKLEFRLHGKRLTGEWTLVRMRDREKDKGRHNWLLIKRSDEVAREGDNDSLLKRNNTSVVSKRSMEQIAAAEDRVWQSKKAIRTVRQDEPPIGKPALKKSRSKIPDFIAPQLATLADAMPQGANWVHEVKFDGYRALAYLQDNQVRIFTRTGKDWTPKFSSLAASLAKLPVKSAIFDGEIVALDEKGTTSFKALQNALSEGHDAFQYYVFDLLYLNGENLMPLPLIKRKQQLEKILKGKSAAAQVFYSEHFAAKDSSMLEKLCDMRMEGVVSKRADMAYASGRGTAWLKTKCHQRQEFVIGGFTQPTHAERGVGALLIGYYEADRFIYAGKVGTGFDNQTSLQLRKQLDKLLQQSPAFQAVPADGRRGAKWVKPVLVCEVEFTEWTGEGRLRHPSFQGLREDKPATTIRRDTPVAVKKVQKETAKTGKIAAKADGGITYAGVRLSHPDRVIFPGTEITKAQLAEYYLSVAEHLLPHVKNRPLSMLRCPEGIGQECFFQRHIARGQSPHLYEADVEVKERQEVYLMIKDVKGLITLVQWGVIELHPWGCRADRPDLPDRIIFDLDPDPAVPWSHMIEGVEEVRMRMQEFGLESFVKTTGGKGLHVVVPVARYYGWSTIKPFARAIADSMQHDNPGRYIARSSKRDRKGKIFIDYLRNDLTSTAVAPFSVRAREGAPVAMTLGWKDIKPGLKPADFNIETALAFLRKRKADPWEEFFHIKQKIAAAHLRALNIE